MQSNENSSRPITQPKRKGLPRHQRKKKRQTIPPESTGAVNLPSPISNEKVTEYSLEKNAL